MNIVLIGFRGAGKTCVGKLLAGKLKWSFVDADEFIERRYGFMVSELIEKHSESLFRLFESDVINQLSKLDSHIIAAGGGAVLKYKNVRNLKRNGKVFWLHADCDTICQRILKDDKTGKKPVTAGSNELFNKIRDLMAFREQYYKQSADYIIKTTDSAPEMVANSIYGIIKKQTNIS